MASDLRSVCIEIGHRAPTRTTRDLHGGNSPEGTRQSDPHHKVPEQR